MNRQQTVPHGLLYSVSPQHLAHLHLSEDAFTSGLDWDESEHQYMGESLAGEVLEFLKELAGK